LNHAYLIFLLLSEPIEYLFLLYVPVFDDGDEFILADVEVEEILEDGVLAVRVEELEDQSLDLRAVVKRFAVVDLKDLCF
jgi:hypothetical protein